MAMSAAAEEELRQAMLKQMNRRILEAAAREVAAGSPLSPPAAQPNQSFAYAPFAEPPLETSTSWRRGSGGASAYRATDRRDWAKPGMARLGEKNALCFHLFY
jgi:hypothetical protein|eukprot:COSAG06_NODE_5393_length_3508_cov_29.096509_3_plen_103_part_00